MEKIDKTTNDLKNIIINLLKTDMAILQFHHHNEDDPNHIKSYNKWIRQCKNSIRIVENIQHIEILCSLYNTFISGKETYFVTLGAVVNKDVKRWDTTKKGFEEFLKMDAEARAKFKEESEEREHQLESIKKAREEGKKIEFVFQNGKLIPVVLEEKEA